MKKPPTKEALRDELLVILEQELVVLEANHQATIEGATHEQAKPENDKDTRALEQSYLARGQAQRIETLKADLSAIKLMPIRNFDAAQAIALGALVVVEEEDAERTLWLAPQGGGTQLQGGKVQVVTPGAPLGRALLGKREGDDLELRLAGKLKALTVRKVR
ncbi:MAG: GreA/GreB family elongation factor [Deltaproteobacteria bacterium]|nr:GreA/GreB family elongation factor [Deltaproteobacteria bacterium]